MLISKLHPMRKKKIKTILNKNRNISYKMGKSFIELKMSLRTLKIISTDIVSNKYALKMDFNILEYAKMGAIENTAVKKDSADEILERVDLYKQNELSHNDIFEIQLASFAEKEKTIIILENSYHIFDGNIYNMLISAANLTPYQVIKSELPDLIDYFEVINESG